MLFIVLGGIIAAFGTLAVTLAWADYVTNHPAPRRAPDTRTVEVPGLAHHAAGH